jgi:acyl-coenzyme A synthetase/AMP-(fatty) acid ligase
MDTLTLTERPIVGCDDVNEGWSADADFSFYAGKIVGRAELLRHALNLSRHLPEGGYALNLCRDRYFFIVAFLAVILKQQRNLLPPNQTPHTVAQLLGNYPRSYCITDKPGFCEGSSWLLTGRHLEGDGGDFPPLPDSRIVALSFTSGSTGQPKVIAKTWGEFRHAARLALRQLGLSHSSLRVVSTVPPQHMYGLETSLFWPLASQLTVDNRQPFFPEDIRRALNGAPVADAALEDGKLCDRRCLLVSTPAHLKACVGANLKWHNVEMILSSTGPLLPDLAKAVERSFNAPLMEIFGSTETQSYASRRLTESAQWTPYVGMRLSRDGGVFRVSGGHLPRGVNLDDRFEIAADGRFRIIGRSTEIIKVAGKRTSLAELNNLLNAIDGIDDGVFFQHNDERLGALVVGDLSRQQIFAALKNAIDPVFLPRPVYRVERLPRNEVGKLDRGQLMELINVCKQRRNV